jgi:glycerol-3-phosphate dehydrogenase (NAD(P)+)
LPESVFLTTDLSVATKSDVLIISIDSQSLSKLMKELKPYNIDKKIIVLCMKGLEISTGRRLSEIVTDELGKSAKVAVWLGPGHVQEFFNGIPNCMVIDSNSEDIKKLLVEEFSSDLIRFYYGNDLIGNEIGAAAKNVIGIAAGMLDGLHLSTLKGALMSRSTREISRFIEAMGGNGISAYGLCHLGDYEATVFSKFSHNRQFGENFIRGKEYDSLAEGYYTAAAIMNLARKHNVDLPICEAVYKLLYENADPGEIFSNLFSRKLTSEF